MRLPGALDDLAEPVAPAAVEDVRGARRHRVPEAAVAQRGPLDAADLEQGPHLVQRRLPAGPPAERAGRQRFEDEQVEPRHVPWCSSRGTCSRFPPAGPGSRTLRYSSAAASPASRPRAVPVSPTLTNATGSPRGDRTCRIGLRLARALPRPMPTTTSRPRSPARWSSTDSPPPVIRSAVPQRRAPAARCGPRPRPARAKDAAAGRGRGCTGAAPPPRRAAARRAPAAAAGRRPGRNAELAAGAVRLAGAAASTRGVRPQVPDGLDPGVALVAAARSPLRSPGRSPSPFPRRDGTWPWPAAGVAPGPPHQRDRDHHRVQRDLHAGRR